MKVGDLVRNKNSESGLLGLFARWRTFDKTYTCPIVVWQDGRIGSIQTSMVEVVQGALSDEQLEDVIGGASPEAFSQWRAERINAG